MVATRLDSSGYYDIRDTGEFHDQSERAIALRALIDRGVAPEKKEFDARQRKINDAISELRFADIQDFLSKPDAVIDEMISAIRRFDGDGVILEPSAGIGSIIDRAHEQWPDAFIVFCERHLSLYNILKMKQHDHAYNGVCGDFITDPLSK